MKKRSRRKLNGNGSYPRVVSIADLPPIDLSTQRLINRDLSWIDFNSRVLFQSSDRNVPLLERVKFLSIVTNNFDEFFMKRLGGFKGQIMAGISTTSVDGLNTRQQVVAIRKKVLPLLKEQAAVFTGDIKPALAEEGIFLLGWNELTEKEKEYAADFFQKKVFPILTPLAVDSGHPFPFLSNLSTSLGFALAHPGHEETLFARVKISEQIPQWILLDPEAEEKPYRFLSLQELVRQHAELLFPRMNVIACMPFRVTRNTNIEIDEEDAEDLLEQIEKELRQRRVGQVVRLEHPANPDPWILSFLTEELELAPEDVYELEGELDYTDLQPILDLDLPKLKYPRWTPVTPPGLLDETSMFHVIRNHDLMVHHPYESFSTTVERFVREASQDPKVLSIKMTVYRVGQVTPLIPYLIQAAEKGKQVVCLVELKARFDEKQNIHWAHMLEKAGVHVVYGIPGLKTHAKTLLVARQDPDGIRCYAHCGTGNYHASTANLYTDLGLFTSKTEYTNELLHFFNYLTGRSLKDNYERLLVAPVTMEKRFIASIAGEIENHRRGLPAHIIAKMNGLEDQHIIEELYRASQEGVKIDLIVRGLCCLRPGVPGMSENIRVISVVGRLLEHSRIFYFRNGKENPVDGDFFIGSADWMGRNMHRRIEVALPVEDKNHRERCMQIFNVMLDDCQQAWMMNPDGSYTRRTAPGDKPASGTHETLMSIASSTQQQATAGAGLI